MHYFVIINCSYSSHSTFGIFEAKKNVNRTQKEDNDQNKAIKWSNQIAVIWCKPRILHTTKKEENKGEEILILLVIRSTRNHDRGRGQKE